MQILQIQMELWKMQQMYQLNTELIMLTCSDEYNWNYWFYS